MSESCGADAAESSSTLEEVVEEGKNKTHIYCKICSSLILLPQKATFKRKELFLPYMDPGKRANGVLGDGETLNDFWLVEDMFTFENLGFTNTVNYIKYLICADCEIGPIGVHDTRQNKQFYIALDRVKYKK